jgi:hypothetical protein
MLKLKPHHHIMLVLLVLFLIAWLSWTFYVLPGADARRVGNPAASAQ